jgi:ABC-type polysaccharide/polyol phosphate export permease
MEPLFRRSFAIQKRVIGALLLREIITRYGRHNIGVLWLVVEPMLFTLGVAGFWYVAKLHTVSNIPIIAFAITGYSSVLVWRNAANRCAKAIEPNLSLSITAMSKSWTFSSRGGAGTCRGHGLGRRPDHILHFH